MRLSAIFSALLGLLLGAFGILMFLGTIIGFSKPENQQSTAAFIFGLLLLGIFPIAIAIALFYFAWRDQKNQKLEKVEREILNLAMQFGGKLTVSQVSMNTRLPSHQAKEHLEFCHVNGLADVQVSENGEVEYFFFGAG